MTATPNPTTGTDTERPNPVADHLAKVGPALGSLVGLVTWAGSAGLLSATTTEVITDYAGEIAAAAAPTGPISIGAGAIIGLIAGGGTVLAALRAGRRATTGSTPLSDPRDRDMAPLVRADGLPLGGNPIGTGRRLTSSVTTATIPGDAL